MKGMKITRHTCAASPWTLVPSQPVSESSSVFDSCYLEAEFQSFVRTLTWDTSLAAFPYSLPVSLTGPPGSWAATFLTLFIWQIRKFSWLCPREIF